MDNEEFNYKKQIIDELYKAELITGIEWYEALSKFVNELDIEKESISV